MRRAFYPWLSILPLVTALGCGSPQESKEDAAGSVAGGIDKELFGLWRLRSPSESEGLETKQELKISKGYMTFTKVCY